MMRTLRQLSLITLLTATAAQAQIPNGGFESWTDAGTYMDPTGWASLNVLTSTFGEISCEQGAPGAVGNFYASITTVDLPGVGLVPGLLLSGDAAASTDGFPYTSRPQALNGQWQYAPGGEDQGSIVVSLSRWDEALGERVIIATGFGATFGSITSWTDFSIPLEYADEQNPDSASIVILSSTGTGVAGSTMWVDDLSFGTITAVAEVTAGALSTFPVPAVDELTVTAPAAIQELSLWSMDGRLVLSARPSDLRTTVSVSDLPSGAYAVQVRLSDGRTLRQVIIRQ